MLKYFDATKKNSLKKLEFILESRKINQKTKTSAVRKILSDVKKLGDKAVIKYERKFSKIKSRSSKIKFSNDEINKISKKINKNLKKSIDIAYTRIKNFHSKQKSLPFKFKDKFKQQNVSF